MVQMGPRGLKGVLGGPGGPSYVQGSQIECKEAQIDPSWVKGIHVGSKELLTRGLLGSKRSGLREPTAGV